MNPASIILVTGSPNEPDLELSSISRLFTHAQLQIFTVSYPATAHAGILEMAKFGKHYAVTDDELAGDNAESVANLKVMSQLSKIYLDILSIVEDKAYQTTYESVSWLASRAFQASRFNDLCFF